MNPRSTVRSIKELARWVENLVKQLDQLLTTQGIAEDVTVSDAATREALRNALGLWESLAQLLSSHQN